ncbi:hypothetical protein BDQ17DRAFT_1425510 [Cyathus striatus]|nr:hypothetical protein BDQ17DRAFT_1425510 [Cyathus striatus]
MDGDDLGPTYGTWLTLWLWHATSLVVFSLVFQDHWGIKAMVVILIIFETLQVTLFFASTYRSFIDDFGNPTSLTVITWQDSTQLLAGVGIQSTYDVSWL